MCLNPFEKTRALADAVVCCRIFAVDGNHMRRPGKPTQGCRPGRHDPIRWHNRVDPLQKAGIHIGLATDESRVNKSLTTHSLEERDDRIVA
jgi:hypothetical protein